ncbi:MAG: histidine ammonia-lyase [Deltaproteobacteria bacterium]|nr:histidine ammonia-lyase [Deltaproteobacteria bacterium]
MDTEGSSPPERGPVGVGEALTLADVEAVASRGASAILGPAARHAMQRARQAVEARLDAAAPATYGVNTGFGALAEVRIPPGDLKRLQLRLLRSHAAGVGAPLAAPIVRAMILLRAHVLALGASGVRPVVVERLLRLLDADVIPVIPAQGSVGASGDLAPLAHLALVLIGEGSARFAGETLPGALALERAGLTPLELEAKEGLSLINGTQGMLAVGILALLRAEAAVFGADVTGAMTLEAMRGSPRPFDDAVVALRPHPGALAAASHLRALLDASEIVQSHRDCAEVQDAYSLRCMPQVHGSARDLLGYARRVLEIELGSVTDNPLVLGDGVIQSGGNFHGQPVAAALDVAALAVVDMASIAERRVAQLVDPHLNRGLPAFLAATTGLDSGFMMAQVTAASLVSESRALAHPKSVDSVPTSADREDHVSMGMTSARHFARVVEHLEHVLAIEALVAAEGVRLRGLRPGRGVEAACTLLRERIPPFLEDRELHLDIAASRELLTSGALLAAADGQGPGGGVAA